MDNQQMIQEILRLKKEKNAVILVHNYQRKEIQDLADHLGDSLGLSRIASKTEADVIIFCGVKFMAETAKILSPDKKVLLPQQAAGCPMAEMAGVQDLKALKNQHQDAMVITYVNSTAEVKAETDVCCTSANAVTVVKNVKADKIIFAPDKNLAAYVQRFTEKEIIPWDGYCYVHEKFTPEEITKAKAAYPNAVVIVHPECPPDVIDMADEVFSTSGMVTFTRQNEASEFLVGTEEGMLYRLKKESPEKTFFSLGTAKMCRGMKMTHLEDLYQSLLKEQFEITLPEDIMTRARGALERMLYYV
ncbi:quinolinate synthase NadA [bacterium]|nr:quinolinate synthase NadA [bacterium]